MSDSNENRSQRTVWKFPFEVDDRFTVEMPYGARFLHVGLDPKGQPCLWAVVDPDEPTMSYTFRVLGTGHDYAGSTGAHIGSFVDGAFMWHVFEGWLR